MPRAELRALILIATALLAGCATKPAPHHASQEVTTPPCPTPQSPRRLEHYDQRSDRSIVENGPDDSWIYYTPRTGGERQKLLQCGQHYHCHIEHVQPCTSGVPLSGEPCAAPAPGDWIEVHTVYAAAVGTDCNPETLDCCAKAPFVVRAYQARVAAAGNPADPLPAPWHPPFAEWSGSNTGPDEQPRACKPLEVDWNFALGCDLRVSQAQLSRFHHPDPARALQGGQRISKDLTRVEP